MNMFVPNAARNSIILRERCRKPFRIVQSVAPLVRRSSSRPSARRQEAARTPVVLESVHLERVRAVVVRWDRVSHARGVSI